MKPGNSSLPTWVPCSYPTPLTHTARQPHPPHLPGPGRCWSLPSWSSHTLSSALEGQGARARSQWVKVKLDKVPSPGPVGPHFQGKVMLCLSVLSVPAGWTSCLKAEWTVSEDQPPSSWGVKLESHSFAPAACPLPTPFPIIPPIK